MKLSISILSLIMCVVACNFSFASTINVPTDHTNIQAAIDAAVDGDTILIKPGTYTENINFKGKTIVVGSLYLSTEDESYISSTIIDGGMKGPVVLFENNENRESQLVGLTIKKTTAQECKEFTGYSIGGVSPIAHDNKPKLILIDKNLSKYEKVFAAAGHPYVVFSVTYLELVKLTNGTVNNIVE